MSVPKPVGPTVLVLPSPSGIPRPFPPGHVATGAPTEYKPRYVPGQLLVKFAPGARARAEQDALARVGGSVGADLSQIGLQVVSVPKPQTGTALATLQNSPAVDYVERDVAVGEFATPNDPLWPSQWGLADVHLPKAWDATQGSPQIIIAVLDSGVDLHQADLAGATVQGYDVVNGDADPSDDQGHGTAAAGVLAARTNNRQGQAGICWRCTIMPVKVLDANGFGTTAGIAAGIVWAVDHGARVISMSLGAPTSTQTLEEAVTYAASKGVIMVAAAGNAGSSTPSYPAVYPDVISVAATAPSGALYSWSNFGSWVQVAAPGCDPAPWPGKGYVNFCGTSAAAPIVAGIVGLALAAKPNASATQIEQAVTGSASPIPDQVRYGLVDAAGVLAALGVKISPASSLAADGLEPAFQGRLTARTLEQHYTRSLTAGQLTAELAFAGASTLTLEIDDAAGPIARVSGRSPLRLAALVAAGRHRFTVSGQAPGASFALAFSTQRP